MINIITICILHIFYLPFFMNDFDVLSVIYALKDGDFRLLSHLFYSETRYD